MLLPPLPWVPHQPYICLSRKRGKEVFHWECGDWEILLLSVSDKGFL